MPNTTKTFKIKAVVDFYGPSELIVLPQSDNEKSPEGIQRCTTLWGDV